MNNNINNEYWMNIVDCIAQASTCRVKIGAILVHKNIIVGVGYVGSIPSDVHCQDIGCLLLPNYGIKGTSNNELSCERCIHAEMNAILKSNVRGSEDNGWLELYSTYSPCLNCFKVLLTIGTRKFIYQKNYKDDYRDKYFDEFPENIKNSIYWRKV